MNLISSIRVSLTIQNGIFEHTNKQQNEPKNIYMYHKLFFFHTPGAGPPIPLTGPLKPAGAAVTGGTAIPLPVATAFPGPVDAAVVAVLNLF